MQLLLDFHFFSIMHFSSLSFVLTAALCLFGRVQAKNVFAHYMVFSMPLLVAAKSLLNSS
jgi:hypothetical protein